jgi:hypothetical protein
MIGSREMDGIDGSKVEGDVRASSCPRNGLVIQLDA